MLPLNGQKIIEEKNVKMVTFHSYKVTVENKSYYRGYTDNADIWNIKAYGKDTDDLFKNLAPEFFIEHFGNIINPESFKFEIVEIITIIDIDTGHTLYQIENDEPIVPFNEDTNKQVGNNFYDSSFYKEEREKYRKRQEGIKNEQNQEQEAHEKKELARLLKKYHSL